MTGGITSVPLPAYWSSKTPEQWKRGPLRTLACSNPRCAANNVNYSTVGSKSPVGRSGRQCRTSSRSRSLSVTSNPSTPEQADGEARKCGELRCSDCNAPLIPLSQTPSRTTPSSFLNPAALSTNSLTPPTPISARSATPRSYLARLDRSYCITSYVAPRTRELPPYIKRPAIFRKNTASAPPPSECGGDYNDDIRGKFLSEEVVQSGKGEDDFLLRNGQKPSPSADQARTPGDDTENGSASPHVSAEMINAVPEKRTASPFQEHVSTEDRILSHPQNSPQAVIETEELLVEMVDIDIATAIVAGKVLDEARENANDTLLSTFEGSNVESESSASPSLSEKGLNNCNELLPFSDRNRISSFYNALYTPDTNNGEEQELDLFVRRSGAEHALKLKVAVEIALLSAFVTILVLACLPSFLSSLRYHTFGCCSCTNQTASVAPSRHFEQLLWFERWVYRGAHNLLGCRSPTQVIGRTLLT
ncbi:hypothetical protein MPTK2_1g03390 [Marchantia polymorpha subsp. ruderalis]